jgi:hypothetical protein
MIDGLWISFGLVIFFNMLTFGSASIDYYLKFWQIVGVSAERDVSAAPLGIKYD